jgi:hypothetical protein
MGQLHNLRNMTEKHYPRMSAEDPYKRSSDDEQTDPPDEPDLAAARKDLKRNRVDDLVVENAALQEQLCLLQKKLRPLEQVQYQRIVIGFNPFGGPSAQDALNKWLAMPLPKGATRYGAGIGGVRDTYSNNVVIDGEMSTLDAVAALDAAMAHFNEIGAYMTFKLATMDKASFEGGWTARP